MFFSKGGLLGYEKSVDDNIAIYNLDSLYEKDMETKAIEGITDDLMKNFHEEFVIDGEEKDKRSMKAFILSEKERLSKEKSKVEGKYKIKDRDVFLWVAAGAPVILASGYCFQEVPYSALIAADAYLFSSLLGLSVLNFRRKRKREALESREEVWDRMEFALERPVFEDLKKEVSGYA